MIILRWSTFGRNVRFSSDENVASAVRLTFYVKMQFLRRVVKKSRLELYDSQMGHFTSLGF